MAKRPLFVLLVCRRRTSTRVGCSCRKALRRGLQNRALSLPLRDLGPRSHHLGLFVLGVEQFKYREAALFGQIGDGIIASESNEQIKTLLIESKDE